MWYLLNNIEYHFADERIKYMSITDRFGFIEIPHDMDLVRDQVALVQARFKHRKYSKPLPDLLRIQLVDCYERDQP